VNFGYLCGLFIQLLDQTDLVISTFTVGIIGAAQLAFMLAHLCEKFARGKFLPNIIAKDEVRINISVMNIFKAFRPSLFLLAIYVFYNSIMMKFELQCLEDEKQHIEMFLSVPIIYTLINYLLELALKFFGNLHMFSIFLLVLQIFFSILDVGLRQVLL
jgi:hypothetical protein